MQNSIHNGEVVLRQTAFKTQHSKWSGILYLVWRGEKSRISFWIFRKEYTFVKFRKTSIIFTDAALNVVWQCGVDIRPHYAISWWTLRQKCPLKQFLLTLHFLGKQFKSRLRYCNVRYTSRNRIFREKYSFRLSVFKKSYGGFRRREFPVFCINEYFTKKNSYLLFGIWNKNFCMYSVT
jgi:hypothetical protein